MRKICNQLQKEKDERTQEAKVTSGLDLSTILTSSYTKSIKTECPYLLQTLVILYCCIGRLLRRDVEPKSCRKKKKNMRKNQF